MNAHLRIFLIIRRGEQGGPLALRIIRFQQVEIAAGDGWLLPDVVEQVEVIVGIIEMFVCCVLLHQSLQHAFAFVQIIEFVFQNDAGMQQSVVQNLIAFCHLLFGKRNLSEIVGTLMRIFFCIQVLLFLLLKVFLLCLVEERIALFISHFFYTFGIGYYGLVAPSPIVYVLSLTPEAFKLLFALGYGRLGIEIPGIGVAETAVAHGSVSEAG